VSAAGRWPTFLVIGAYKSGTTTLHHVLRAHPDVYVPERREPSYFAFADSDDRTRPAWHRAVRDEDEYRRLFAPAGAAAAFGEVSPEYLLHPDAAAAIARRIPDVTLLAVLRNPVDRAFSDWAMYRRDGTERLSFEAALDVQEERRQRGEPTGSYLEAGRYAEQLQRFVAAFGPRRVHVWLYDDVTNDAAAAYREIFTVLGVRAVAVPSAHETYNVGASPTTLGDRLAYAARLRLRPVTSRLPLAGLRRRVGARLDERLVRPILDPRTRARLVDYFRPDVERLQEIIDRDLSPWLRS
jgi:hypothetical protein